jgi:signal transduction histidine kinase/CheY-like chemotaxis protein
MLANTAPSAHPLHDDLTELRTESLGWLSGAAVVAAFACLCVGATLDYGEPRVLVLPTLLLAVGSATWALLRRTFVGAACCLLVGLAAASVVTAVAYRAAQPLYALPVVVFVAPLLVRYRSAVLGAAGASLLVWWVRVSGAVPLSAPDLLAIVGLVVVSAALAWISYRPTWIMLSWAWSSYLAEHRKTDEVRERQAELVALTRRLSDACVRLEHLNAELEHARRAADEARRLKAEFAATLSHELRTPLNLVIGFSEMMMRSPGAYAGGALPEAYREDLAAIHENASQMSRLVDDVLDLSQIDAHRLALDRRPAALRPIVEEAVAVVRALYVHAGLTLAVEVPDDLPWLNVDPLRVRQIMINLLGNAVRHTDQGGVVVRATADERDVVIAVADTGSGMAPADLPGVFRAFQQAGPAGQRRGGSGLGLAICQRFAEMHGGCMWAESELGRGSVFYLALPRTANVVTLPTQVRTLTRSEREPCLVVVDPGRELPRLFRRYLDGYRVVRAGCRRDLRRIAASRPVHALVVAEGQIAGDAAELRGAHDSLRNVPIFTCALGGPAPLADGLAAAYLTKPIGRARLAQALRRAGPAARDVLVVDDDPDMVRLLAGMVGGISRRYRVRGAGDGVEALARMRAERPDLVVLDLQMPGLDGEAVLRAMRRDPALRAVPAVVVTGRVALDRSVRAPALGLSRPDGLSVGELVRCVQHSLDALLRPPRAGEPGATAEGAA